MSLPEFLLAALPAAAPAWYAQARAQVYGRLQQDWAHALRADPRARRVLDWGTGCGELARALGGRGAGRGPGQGPEVVDAVDESDALLLFAEERAEEEELSPAPRFRLLDRAASPFPGPYDRVLCLGWRHATEPLPRTLSRVHRRLAPGGELWWADLRVEDGASRGLLRDALHASLRAPSWWPDAAWKAALRAALQRLPTESEVERAVQDSAFGRIHERRRLDLPLGPCRLPGTLLELRLRREELVS